MTYRIRGLEPGQFTRFHAMQTDELASERACRVTATADHGFPCRVSLRDAGQGEELLLLHHVSHSVETPYRSAYAIYVRRSADSAAEFIDECPPVFEGRPIALRGFCSDGMLQAARLALPGEADTVIRAMLEDAALAYIDAHNAAHGCFAARIERHGG